jgi:hypothetical protein
VPARSRFVGVGRDGLVGDALDGESEFAADGGEFGEKPRALPAGRKVFDDVQRYFKKL